MSKFVLLALALTVATAGIVGYNMINLKQDDDIPMITKDDMSTPEYDMWTHYQTKYGKKYASDSDYRMSVYHYNYNKLKEFYNSKATYQRGQTEFMDLTPAEFSRFYLGYKHDRKVKNSKQLIAEEGESTPSSVDQRKNGVVTAVKNQGQCGSCWAFSTTGAVEGLYAQTMGSQKTFSEQQLVDCSSSYGNNGCNGGLMDDAFQYVEAKGLETESQYPYEAVQEYCEYAASGDFKIGGYQDVGGYFGATTSDLKKAIAIRPVSIAVDAQNWSSYTGGIYPASDCGTQLDHGVLAVGYTDDYWIVKNSWGESWGEEGYIRLAMGNTCGILNSASYPTA